MSRDEKYLETLISVLEADKKQLTLFIGLELAVPLFTIKDVSFGKDLITGVSSIPNSIKVIIIISMICFLAAAFFHFKYLRRVHANTFAVARFLLNGTGEDARALLFDDTKGLWAKHGWNYNLAMVFLYLACASYALVLFNVIF